MQGTVAGRDLFELVKLFIRLKKTGVVTVVGDRHAAEIHLDGGRLVAGFHDDDTGHQALIRALLMSGASFTFDASAKPAPANVTQDSALLCEAIEHTMAEHGERVWGEGSGAAATTSAAVAAASDDPFDAADRAAAAGQAPASAAEAGQGTIAISAFQPPQVGDVLGHCRLDAQIGQGASSLVFRARHRAFDLDVVVKVLIEGADASQGHRFLTVNEAQLLARLNHPNVVRVFDFDDRGRYPYVVMEYVDGGSLSSLMTNGPVPAETVLPIFLQVSEALAYAYRSAGLVHCDLKPDNILLTSQQEAKLADFGLAHAVRLTVAQKAARAHMPSGVSGTPAYIAPEQVTDGLDGTNHRSDIYSLGATFYHALTGRPPFEDPDPLVQMTRRLTVDAVPPHLVNPAIDRRLSDLVMQMLVRDPVHRIHTCDDLTNVLHTIIKPPAKPVPEAAPNDEGRARRGATGTLWGVPAMLFRKTGDDHRG
jgi:tRNA A-37 threonylcarbamoyl transferase component Bud32